MIGLNNVFVSVMVKYFFIVIFVELELFSHCKGRFIIHYMLLDTILNVPNLDDDYFKGKNQKRGVLPKSATQVMKSWLFQHIVVSYIIIQSKETQKIIFYLIMSEII